MGHVSRRRFIQTAAWSAAGTSVSSQWLATRACFAAAPDTDRFDLIVIGGTPGGIAAAVTAARLGRSVALAEYHAHFGAMSASGLGKSDIENRAMIRGLFAEFVGRVQRHYVDRYGADSENVRLCRDGYFYEPSVAEAIFGQMLQQPGITLLPNHLLVAADTQRNKVTSVTLRDRNTGKDRVLSGAVFVDATYEGDLYALVGAEFRLGREGREDFGEPHAGHIYYDWRNQQPLPGGTGQADKRIPTYTYRLCLTSDTAKAHRLSEPPDDYDRSRYLGYVDDLTWGRFGPSANLTRIALSIAPIPNRKTDVNMNPRGLGFVFVGENEGYIEADSAGREKISRHLRNLTLGLLWFLQNDDVVPQDARDLARTYHLPKDEFADNGHFPFQLYVREARRLVGEYTLSERNITEQAGLTSERRHADAIAVGEFPIDSFPIQKRQPGDDRALEGYLCMLNKITRPYQVPYRIMIPQKVDGLIVPVAASTTHVAFSSIRLEPTWMALGQAAGVAAHVALDHGTEVRAVPISEVQAILRKQDAVLDFEQAGVKGK